MPPKNVNTELDAESLNALRQGRSAIAQLRNIGVPVQPLEPQIIKQEPLESHKPIPVKKEPIINYDNFIEVANLPSKGLFYANKVYGQALKMEDILQIQSMDDGNLTSNLSEIFNRRFRGLDAEEITIADELYMALWLRASSFPDGDHPSIGFKCKNKKCKFEMRDPSYEIKFQQITFDAENSPDSLYELYKNTGYVEEILPESKIPIKIEIRRRYHTRLIEDILNEDYYNKDLLPDEYYKNLLRISAVISIDDIEDLRERAKRIGELSTKDSYALIKMINKYSLMSEPIINHICPACGEVTPVRGYPFRIETYLPLDY